uniref:Uncharacterized protein n=1 Tax=Anopheles christyi TaxID=43041 RepID=A0A182KI06_9DIPT
MALNSPSGRGLTSYSGFDSTLGRKWSTASRLRCINFCKCCAKPGSICLIRPLRNICQFSFTAESCRSIRLLSFGCHLVFTIFAIVYRSAGKLSVSLSMFHSSGSKLCRYRICSFSDQVRKLSCFVLKYLFPTIHVCSRSRYCASSASNCLWLLCT